MLDIDILDETIARLKEHLDRFEEYFDVCIDLVKSQMTVCKVMNADYVIPKSRFRLSDISGVNHPQTSPDRLVQWRIYRH